MQNTYARYPTQRHIRHATLGRVCVRIREGQVQVDLSRAEHCKREHARGSAVFSKIAGTRHPTGDSGQTVGPSLRSSGVRWQPSKRFQAAARKNGNGQSSRKWSGSFSHIDSVATLLSDQLCDSSGFCFRGSRDCNGGSPTSATTSRSSWWGPLITLSRGTCSIHSFRHTRQPACIVAHSCSSSMAAEAASSTGSGPFVGVVAESTTAAAEGGSARDSAVVAASGVDVDVEMSADIISNINMLKAQQALLRAKKKEISKKLRNEEKRRSRIKKRAKLLTDKDLVDLIRLRAVEARGAAPSSGAGTTSEGSS